MSLIDLERAVVAVCFEREAPAARLSQLGDARVFRVYREAVRNRLKKELEVAFERTFAKAGSALVERAFERFLAERPPRTRFFHQIPASFAESALPLFRAEQAAAPELADLCAYEAALWAVADLPDRAELALAEFAFEKKVVFSPALRLLELRYPVHLEPRALAAAAPGPHYVCVHRPPEAKRGQPWSLNASSFALMQRLLGSEQSVAEAVRAVAAERGLALDQAFVDGLCGVLADFLERGVILGSRAE